MVPGFSGRETRAYLPVLLIFQNTDAGATTYPSTFFREAPG
jgi:hypothetical protein